MYRRAAIVLGVMLGGVVSASAATYNVSNLTDLQTRINSAVAARG
jgi:hypothetical protein